MPSITNLNHAEVKIIGNSLWEAGELMIENERLKTVNNMLTSKLKDQDTLMNDLDFLKKKNRGLVRMIEQLRKENQSFKADMSAKNLQIKSKDCCITTLKCNIDKIAVELE